VQGASSFLAQAAFALKRNDEVTPQPIRTQGGFSVLIMVETLEAKKLPAAEARELLREQLAQERSEQALEAVVTELRANIATTTHPERVAAIELDPPMELDIPRGFPASPRDPLAPPIVKEPDAF
jgi:hypothetical protein